MAGINGSKNLKCLLKSRVAEDKLPVILRLQVDGPTFPTQCFWWAKSYDYHRVTTHIFIAAGVHGDLVRPVACHRSFGYSCSLLTSQQAICRVCRFARTDLGSLPKSMQATLLETTNPVPGESAGFAKRIVVEQVAVTVPLDKELQTKRKRGNDTTTANDNDAGEKIDIGFGIQLSPEELKMLKAPAKRRLLAVEELSDSEGGSL